MIALTEIREDAILREIFVVSDSDVFGKGRISSRSSCQTKKSRRAVFVNFEENRSVEGIVDSIKVAVMIALDSNVREFGFGVEEGIEGSIWQRAASKMARSHISPRSLFSGTEWPNKGHKESSSSVCVRK